MNSRTPRSSRLLKFFSSGNSICSAKLLRNQELPKLQTDPARSPDWRVRIKHAQLVSQASSILLQRQTNFWPSLLHHLKLLPNFTPSLFHQILNKINTHPKICLDFFNYAQKHFDFKPDLKAQCKVTRILLEAQFFKLGIPILNSIIQDYPPTKFLPLLIQSSGNPDKDTVSSILNSTIDCYCRKRFYLQGLEVYRLAKLYGFGLGLGSCNALLDLLCNENEIRLAWCCYASMIRSGVSGDGSTWSVVSRILYKDGKFERISMILGMGIYVREVFDLLINGHSRRGDFAAAFAYLKEMQCKGIEPNFNSFSSMLDGACKHGDTDTIINITSQMVEKGLISYSDYDSIIQKLCRIQKTFAMELFYKKACVNKIELKQNTYECMLRALFSEDGRITDAIQFLNVTQEKNVSINAGCYNEFVGVLCQENPSQEVSKLLLETIRGGLISELSSLSIYISKLCNEGQWRNAEKLMDAVLAQGFLLKSVSCGLLVQRHCRTNQIEKAITLHDKVKLLGGAVDAATYEVLLGALWRKRRGEEAVKVFDYTRRCEATSSRCYCIMIRGLCAEKEFRKAMKLHDEMVELGFKPNIKEYKRLISGFG